jgi:alpha-beta hydrolase superfamily lysophospholipase
MHMRDILTAIAMMAILSAAMQCSGARVVTGSFEGSDGTELFYRSWITDKPRATVIIVHGWGEHSNRYADLAEYLAGQGFSVHAMDLRGHGHSGGARGQVNDFNDYVSDLEGLIERERGYEKLFIVGHSLGASIALEYARQHQVDGVVLSGISLKSSGLSALGEIPLINRIPIPVGEIGARLLGEKAVSSMCSNESALEGYLKDDLAHGTLTLKFIRELSEESRRLRSEIPEPRSCLIMMGSDDRVGSLDDARFLYSALPTEDKDLIIYEGMRHNIFDEVDNTRVFHDVNEWILRHLQS